MSSSPTFQAQQEPLAEIDRLPDPAPTPNRLWYRRIRLSWVFLGILGNCLTASGVAVFPLVAPYITHRFALDQARTNTVVVGGICGQYFLAALIGAFADAYGPRWTSLLAALFNIVGYSFLTYLLSLSSSTPTASLPLQLPIQFTLALAYFIIGAGAISSYFSSLKASTLNFPSHPSLAIAIPLSAFGLGSAFLAALSGLDAFTDVDRPGELDARLFSAVLVVLVGGWNLLAAIAIKVMPDREESKILAGEDAVARIPTDAPSEVVYPCRHNDEAGARGGPIIVDEETPLMGGRKMDRGSIDLGLGDLLSNKGFWSLGLAMFLLIGPAEMFINSVGSIITSLITPEPSRLVLFASPTTPLTLFVNLAKSGNSQVPSPLHVRQTHVQIISLTNTLSRLVTGFLADYFSSNKIPPPPPSSPSSSSLMDPNLAPSPSRRRYTISKVTMLLGVVMLLVGAYVFGATGVTTSSLWVVTGLVGWCYGSLFTLTPTLTTQIFGIKTFGRNFGILSYFCAISSLAFTYLYSHLADAHAHRQHAGEPPVIGIPENPSVAIGCRGRACFEGTLWLAVGATVGGGVVLWTAGRQWRKRGI